MSEVVARPTEPASASATRGERAAYVLEHRVTLEETNAVGNVYFAHYARWQGKAREMFIIDKAPTVLDDLSAGLKLVTVSLRIDFGRELFAGDQIQIHLRLHRLLGHQIAMDFEYLVLRDGMWLSCAHGQQEIACLREERPCDPPLALVNALSSYSSLL